jgi:hypothetical protein
VHGLQAQLGPHAHVAAAPLSHPLFAVVQVHGVHEQEVQVQSEMVAVVMASLESEIVIRRSGSSGLRTRIDARASVVVQSC